MSKNITGYPLVEKTKAQIVAMDERFIKWFANDANTYNAIKGKRYIIVAARTYSDTGVTCSRFYGKHTRAGIKKVIANLPAGWVLKCVLDTLTGKTIGVKTKIELM